jgi:hypothetical protein
MTHDPPPTARALAARLTRPPSPSTWPTSTVRRATWPWRRAPRRAEPTAERVMLVSKTKE